MQGRADSRLASRNDAASFFKKGVDFVPRDGVYWCSCNRAMLSKLADVEFHGPTTEEGVAIIAGINERRTEVDLCFSADMA